MLPRHVKVPSECATIEAIKAARERIDQFVCRTPVWRYPAERLPEELRNNEVFCKLELWQKTGSFKPRGALLSILNIPENLKHYGVVAASAGNHAIAVSYAAKVLGVKAKVVMLRSASTVRKELCNEYGAEVLLEDSLSAAFKTMQSIHESELKTIIHPFEGPLVALGTATVGLELCQQVENLDAVIIPVGGGGLCAGMSNAIKQLQPDCHIYGVEPLGANSMQQSFKASKPVAIEKVNTIADSLGAPYAMPYSFALCYRFVDEIVTVSDAELRKAMTQYFYHLKLAVEPAAAASLAALCGPLKRMLASKRVALVVSGTNIDTKKYCEYVNINEKK